MATYVRASRGPAVLIIVGSVIFIFVLGLSAYFEKDIRWLHFFQAWMYLATVALALRSSRWGYFIGISAAVFWDYASVFANTFFRSGLHWLSVSVATGHLQHVDQIIAVPAWTGNFLVIVGCVWGYSKLEKSWSDGVRFVATFVLTTAFFAADMAVFQPRYLPLFRRALHPHSPFASAAPRTSRRSLS